MEEATFTSSGRKLVQLVLAVPAIFYGAMLVKALFGPAASGPPTWLFYLQFCGLLALLFVPFYAGRYVRIRICGSVLAVRKPYSLLARYRSLDLGKVRSAYLTSIRPFTTHLSLYGSAGYDHALLHTAIVPFAAADTAALAALLRERGIRVEF